MNHQVIVISREFGSGGRAIGKLLSERLQIPYYDMALIEMTAERTKSNYEALMAVDEKRVPWMWYSYTDESDRQYSQKRAPMNEELFRVQAEIIKDLAEEGPCIIVGRCADYILRDHDRLLSVFIHADMETKASIIMQHYGLDRKEAEALMRKTDKQRSAYYNHYTNYTWGDISNYHITLDRGRLGVERCAEILEDIYNTL